jgi:hypothetical protein
LRHAKTTCSGGESPRTVHARSRGDETAIKPEIDSLRGEFGYSKQFSGRQPASLITAAPKTVSALGRFSLAPVVFIRRFVAGNLKFATQLNREVRLRARAMRGDRLVM